MHQNIRAPVFIFFFNQKLSSVLADPPGSAREGIITLNIRLKKVKFKHFLMEVFSVGSPVPPSACTLKSVRHYIFKVNSIKASPKLEVVNGL